MYTILNSGQTGVERGAYAAACALGFPIYGFMPSEARDELGPLPADIAATLRLCSERGPRQAQRATIEIASAVVIVVPDARTPRAFTAMNNVMSSCHSRKVPLLCCDRGTSLELITHWIWNVTKAEIAVKVYVTGPRGTRWREGEQIAHRIVTALAILAPGSSAADGELTIG